jgi:Putative transposase
VHFHVCVVDGVFEALAGSADAGADTDTQAVADAQSAPSKVIFHPTSNIDETAVAQVQATLRSRILRAFVGRGLLQSFEAKEMLGYRHSGFSVDTSVRIEPHDRAGLERLLRYCARPAFSMERLRKAGNDLVYRCAKQHSDPSSVSDQLRGRPACIVGSKPCSLRRLQPFKRQSPVAFECPKSVPYLVSCD